MADWLLISKVRHGEREKDVGPQTILVDATFVTYEVEGEPGKIFLAVFEDHLPDDADLVRQVKKKYMHSYGGQRK